MISPAIDPIMFFSLQSKGELRCRETMAESPSEASKFCGNMVCKKALTFPGLSSVPASAPTLLLQTLLYTRQNQTSPALISQQGFNWNQAVGVAGLLQYAYDRSETLPDDGCFRIRRGHLCINGF